MYIFKFTSGNNKIIKGNFPLDYAELLFKEGINYIIISTYSNIIKIPYWDHSIDELDFYQYNL